MFYVVGRKYPPVLTHESPPWPTIDPGNGQRGTTGTWMYANSSLEFNIPAGEQLATRDSIKILVEAKGQKAGGHGAYFNVVVNGQVIGGAFSREEFSLHTFTWESKGQPVESFFIRFVNDLKLPGSDRNLNVLSVSVGGLRMPADNVNTRLTREVNTMTTGFASQAAEAAAYIRSLGIQAVKIKAVSFDPPQRNLTLAAAREFQKLTANDDIPEINVGSSGIHCRRTWITYKKLLEKQSRVGIINFNPENYSLGNEYSDQPFIVHLADEFISYLVNWFQLRFEG